MLKTMSVLTALPLLASMAVADPADRADFEPVTTKAGLEAVEIQRQGTSKTTLPMVKTPTVTVKDVDTNGDGTISFAELLVHHQKTDF